MIERSVKAGCTCAAEKASAPAEDCLRCSPQETSAAGIALSASAIFVVSGCSAGGQHITADATLKAQATEPLQLLLAGAHTPKRTGVRVGTSA
jgi:hypothetical protein